MSEVNDDLKVNNQNQPFAINQADHEKAAANAQATAEKQGR